ncbi:MAG: MaoC family dehydratase [Rhodospirillales bacterium]|nr:MaoC family dehydratase [Rhodospirillales bacterium]
MTHPLRFTEFRPGQRFRSASRRIDAAEIKAFAHQFDPQPFHLDEEAAAGSLFGGLAASGWHTAALAMRMNLDGGLPIAGGIIGNAIDELRWPTPVRAGDTLTAENEVVEVIPSASRPGQGRIRALCRVVNQDGVEVMRFVATLVVRD